MRALTVQQPWAWAIVHGGKTVENRTQAWTYRGPLAIHAGARISDRGTGSRLVGEALDAAVVEGRNSHCFQLGAVIGVVDLVDVHHALPEGEPDYPGQPTNAACCGSAWAEQSYEEHGGRTRRELVHLVLENPRPLNRPIFTRGRLGLWNPTDALSDEIQEALR